METKLRPYTKKELALMYFPDSTPETAVKHLKMMIRSNDMLWDELQEMGEPPSTTNREQSGTIKTETPQSSSTPEKPSYLCTRFRNQKLFETANYSN